MRPALTLVSLVGLLAAPHPAAGAGQERPALRAVRAASPPTIDGDLADGAWAEAPVYRQFNRTFPAGTGSPSATTLVRVIVDADHLYFAIDALDDQAASIDRALGRRDRPPPTDMVTVMLDSAREGRRAQVFSVTAAGDLQDGVIVDENRFLYDWDAIWHAATRVHRAGWSAEIRIPLALFQRPDGSAPWGINVRRRLHRTHEILDAAPIPAESNALVSRFIDLSIAEQAVASGRTVHLLPYAAVRAVRAPADMEGGGPEEIDPSGDVGLDVQLDVTRKLVFAGTLNPDFGQVEADARVLNLTSFELFYPEKRPFFQDQAESFEPVGGQGSIPGTARQQIFYSRRVGLDAPIAAAARLDGRVGSAHEVGLIDALVQDDAERGLPLRNVFAGAFRSEVGRGVHVGESVAALTPIESSCPAPAMECDRRGAVAGAVHLDVRRPGSDLALSAQLAGSRASGPSQLLPDGTSLDDGDLGLGLFVRAGKIGGAPFRWLAFYDHASSELGLDRTGFLSAQNRQVATALAQVVRPEGVGPIQELSSSLIVNSGWSTDGEWTELERGVELAGQARLPGFHQARVSVRVNGERYDIREIRGAGIPLERPPSGKLFAGYGTDASKRFAVNAGAVAERRPGAGPLAPRWMTGAEIGLVARPNDWFTSELTVGLDSNRLSPLFVEERAADGAIVLADADARSLSATLRLLAVLAPRLTVQSHVQVFTSYGLFGPFFQVSPAGRSRIDLADLEPTGPETDPSFRAVNLDMNLVLRWEYATGSTAYLIYTRSEADELAPDSALAPRDLFRGPSVDVVLFKLSYLWDLQL